MDKRTLILDALLELIRADKGASCTISDIAKQAGIAKGGIYYYFSSKEEIMDALVERSYGQVIDHCQVTIEHVELSALPKLALLFRSYYASSVEHSLDHYLHESQNAYSHQQSLVFLLTRSALNARRAQIVFFSVLTMAQPLNCRIFTPSTTRTTSPHLRLTVSSLRVRIFSTPSGLTLPLPPALRLRPPAAAGTAIMPMRVLKTA